MANPSFFYNMLDLARINSAILHKEVTGEKLTRKDYPLSVVAEMQQIFMNAGATSKVTDGDMEFQEVSALKKKESNTYWDFVEKQQRCRNLLQMQEANMW